MGELREIERRDPLVTSLCGFLSLHVADTDHSTELGKDDIERIQRHRLIGIAAASKSEALSASLRSLSRSQQLRGLHQAHCLSEIVTTLDRAGIRAILLKGLAVSTKHYRDIGIRYPGDIDLWISESDLQQAAVALAKLGYRDPAYEKLSPFYQGEFRKRLHHLSFVAPDKTGLELHWSLFKQEGVCPLSFDEAFEKGEDLRVGRCVVRTLNTLDEWLYLHAHAAAHLWERWQWVADLAVIQHARGTEEAERLCRYAEEKGILRTVSCGMKLLEEFLAIPMPEAARRQFEVDPDLKIPFGIAVEKLRGLGPRGGGELSFSELWSGFKALHPSSRDRREFFVTALLNPDDWGKVRLPDHCLWLYFPIRLWFLCKRRLFTRWDGG